MNSLKMKIIPVYKYVVVQDTVKKEFSWAGGILQTLHEMRHSGILCDVLINTADEKHLNAHSAVLGGASPGFFQGLLHQSIAGASSTQLHLNFDVSSTIISAILDYLYTGKALIEVKHLVDLKQAAEAYGFTQLVAVCEKKLMDQEKLMDKLKFSNFQSQMLNIQLELPVLQDLIETQNSEVKEKRTKTYRKLRTKNRKTEVSTNNDKLERKTELPNTENELPNTQTQTELPNTENELPNTQTELPNTENELPNTQTQTELPNTENELPNTQTELPNTETKLPNTETKLPNTETEMRAPEVVLRTSQTDLNSTQIELPNSDDMCDQLSPLQDEETRKPVLERIHYECKLCGKNFTSRVRLAGHEAAVHQGEKRYECQICKKRFIQLEYLKEHVTVHSNLRPYKCSFCQVSFRLKRQMIKHELLHTAKKAFTCPHCDKKYSRLYRLKEHVMCHAGKKPQQCHICHKKFAGRDNLVKHLKKIHKHGSEHCGLCGTNSKQEVAGHLTSCCGGKGIQSCDKGTSMSDKLTNIKVSTEELLEAIEPYVRRKRQVLPKYFPPDDDLHVMDSDVHDGESETSDHAYGLSQKSEATLNGSTSINSEVITNAVKEQFVFVEVSNCSDIQSNLLSLPENSNEEYSK